MIHSKNETTPHPGQSGAAKENNFDQILAMTQAKLQLAGFTVHSVESGHLVCRWAMSKLCADLGELRAFAKKVGAL